LLFNFLGELIYYKDSEQLLLAQQVQISEKMDYSLSVVAQGDARLPSAPTAGDVKAVTLHRFQLEKTTVGRPW